MGRAGRHQLTASGAPIRRQRTGPDRRAQLTRSGGYRALVAARVAFAVTADREIKPRYDRQPLMTRYQEIAPPGPSPSS